MEEGDLSPPRDLGPVIESLAARLEASDLVLLDGGGSPALVVAARDRNGERLVVKLHLHSQGLVDGHDVESFRLKSAQIRALREPAPLLFDRYAAIRETHEGDGWSAYVMNEVRGTQMARLADGPAYTDRAFALVVDRVFRRIAEEGYARRRFEAEGSQLVQAHLLRLRRREWLMRAFLPEALVAPPMLTVNGLACRNPLTDDFVDLGRCDPAYLFLPAHGDLNLRNVIAEPGREENFRLVDPRGSLAPFDPAYDAGKILFSVAGWHLAMTRGFAVRREDGGPPGWTLDLNSGGLHEAALLGDLVFRALAASGYDALFSHPRFYEQALVSAAFHSVAEAACRLSVSRAWPARERSRRDLAAGFFLFGALLLEVVRACEPAAALAALASCFSRSRPVKAVGL